MRPVQRCSRGRSTRARTSSGWSRPASTASSRTIRASSRHNGSFTRPRLPPGYTQALMRRPPLAVVCACSIALFAILGSPAAADETTPPPTTTTPPPTTTTEPLPPPGPKLIQPGVTIGGLLVGGLTGPEARALVEERFEKPVTLVVSSTRTLRVEPTELGAAAQVLKAVRTAMRVRAQGFAVPLSVEVNHRKLDRYLAVLAKT